MNQNSSGHKHGLKGRLRPDVVAAMSTVAKLWKSPDVRRLMMGKEDVVRMFGGTLLSRQE